MMDKKIGNLYAFIGAVVVLTSTQLDASVSLIAKDMYGKYIQEASVGMPFTLEVQVVDGPAQEPSLALPAEVHVLDRSVSTSYRSINGKASGSRTYTYRVRVDQEGSFIIGPAEVIIASQSRLASHTLQLDVRKEVQTAPLKKPFFLESSVRPERMYVGQQVTYILRFYYATDGVTLEQIEDPAFNDCYATKMKGPVSGVEKRDGIDYKYLEWRATLCPKKAGPLVIPALAANIAVSGQGNRRGAATDMFSFMDLMFGSGRVERHYAHALSLDVLPLPEHAGQVHGVGSFTSYTAKVNSKTGSVGEGIVLTLELVGTGNMQAMVHPELELPEHINYYDSHAKEKFLSDVIKKKDFEYIVQCLEPGDYTIPKQHFTFFDPHTKKYKTLSTAPIQLSIKGVAKASQEIKQQEEPAQQVTVTQDDDTLAPIYKASWRAGMPRRFIPWLWYCGLLLGLLKTILFYWLYRRWSDYRAQHKGYYAYRDAFKKAHATLSRLQIGNDAAPVYIMFKQLFAERLQIPEAVICAQVIEDTLCRVGMPAEQQEQWKNYFEQLTRMQFSSTQILTRSLKDETKAWLNRLEKVLR